MKVFRMADVEKIEKMLADEKDGGCRVAHTLRSRQQGRDS